MEPKDRYFVVSDTHLGSNKEGSNVPNYGEFCSFLEWLKSIPDSGTDILIIEGQIEIKKRVYSPTKMILLGDIIDQWDPDKGDRSYIIKEGSRPFALIQGLKCDKVYVVGNHDQDLYELANILQKEKGCIDLDNSKLEVHRRHYPRNVDAGLHIGNKFLFDWNEIPGNESGELIEYLRNNFHVKGLSKEKIQKTDNDRSIKLSGKKNSVILTLNDEKTGVNLIIDDVLKDELYAKLENTKLKIYRKKTFAFIHGQQYDKYQITEPISKKFGIRVDPLDVVQDILNISIVKSVFREKNPTLFYAALILVLYFLRKTVLDSLTKINQSPLSWDFWLGLLVFTGFTLLFSYVVITPLAKIITEIQGPVWKFLFKPRDMTVEEVIKKGYYNERSDHMTVDVVVFGHTHIAGGHYLENKKRLFINTGAWVAEKERDLNTFAYIDDNGISLLSWLGTKKDGMYAFKRVYLDTIFST
ncbi:MAG: hypothetical protein WC556_09655 [Candidatus Methanoperedens sp.]